MSKNERSEREEEKKDKILGKEFLSLNQAFFLIPLLPSLSLLHLSHFALKKKKKNNLGGMINTEYRTTLDCFGGGDYYFFLV